MFLLNKDTLHLTYSMGDEDLAMTYMEMEGYALCPEGHGTESIVYRVASPHGYLWTRRIYTARKVAKKKVAA